MDGTILVADDDRTIRTVLTQALTRAGCRVHATSSLTMLLRWVAEGKGDAVITDVMMPDGNGLEMLPKIAQDRPDLPVIVISAQNTIMTAIQAEQADAFDYLPKPFDLPDLLKRTARALDQSAATRRSSAPRENDASPDKLPLIGRTPVMQALYRMIARVMNADLPVLISGESGTGKSLIARVLHDFSDRHRQPMIVADLASLQDPEALPRLIGQAAGGTLLLEEIGELSAEVQARLVPLLDRDGPDTPRIVATSQVDLSTAMADGRLRKDLYFRLSGAVLQVPSLRERVEDISLLSAHFLAAQAGDGPMRQLSPDAVSVLNAYSWPGNVRQLEHTLRRLALTSATPEIAATEVTRLLSGLPEFEAAEGAAPSSEKLGDSVARHLRRYFDLHGKLLPPAGLYGRILREIELPLIEIALEKTGGNQAKCATLLGINRNTLRKKITDLDIQVTRSRKLM